jgi:hypothetical protein
MIGFMDFCLMVLGPVYHLQKKDSDLIQQAFEVILNEYNNA